MFSDFYDLDVEGRHVSFHVPLCLHLLFKLLLQIVLVVLRLPKLRRELQLLTRLLGQQLLQRRARSKVSAFNSVVISIIVIKHI